MITKNKKVYVKVRDDLPILPGRDRTEVNYKIGSFAENGDVGRGLTFEEEKLYLPEILGISPESPNWDTRTKEYWASISVRVPWPEGIELEVGKNFKEDKDANGKLVDKVGVPINLSDYILYKFCLKHRNVGNEKEVINKSTKIHFYIEDPEKEIKRKKEGQVVKMEAYKILTENSENDRFLTGIILVLGDKLKRYYTNLDSMTIDDKLLEVTDIAEQYPHDFVEASKSSDLEWKAFLITCINNGSLTRLPNTEIITSYEDGQDRQLGSSYQEAIGYLKAENNREFTKRLESKINFKVVPKQ